MKDSLGRTIDYMRVSITDRCNLRCKYCMPYGVESVRHEEILSYEEICETVAAAADLGIRHIKVTGGEPLTRLGSWKLVGMLKSIPGIETVTLTTNGVLLDQLLDPLLEAGIDGINISLDTLDPEGYREITGRDGLSKVLSGLEQALEKNIPVKINAVSVDWESMKKQRSDGLSWKGEDGQGLQSRQDVPWWVPVAELARTYPVHVRFIEMMPIGYGRQFPPLSQQVLLAEMEKQYPGIKRDMAGYGFGPAVYYQVPGFQGNVGFISAIHGKFCDSCNRIRLTARGHLKSCLCFEDGVDLREILRADDMGKEERQGRLRRALETAIRLKPAAHCFEQPERMTELHNMIDIGG